MSTKQRPATNPTEPKHEPNALATWLSNAWGNFKQGKLISYPMMAIILLLVAAVGVTWWILSARTDTQSARWVSWDGRSSVASLEEFIADKNNENTIQVKLARLEIARIHLGPEGIDRMFVKASDFGPPGDPEAEKRAREIREKAVASVEKARDEFPKLADDFKDDPVFHVECLVACAKAEAVLVGIPKEGTLDQRRGDPAKAIEWLDKVAEAAPETPWGKDAKKLADALRNQNTQQQVANLHASLFSISATLPGSPVPPPPQQP